METVAETKKYEMVSLAFGRHKGTRLKDVPSSYLLWLLNPRSEFKVADRVKVSAWMVLRDRLVDS